MKEYAAPSHHVPLSPRQQVFHRLAAAQVRPIPPRPADRSDHRPARNPYPIQGPWTGNSTRTGCVPTYSASITPVIPGTRERKIRRVGRGDRDREALFGCLKRFRRIATRYDKLARTHASTVGLAAGAAVGFRSRRNVQRQHGCNRWFWFGGCYVNMADGCRRNRLLRSKAKANRESRVLPVGKCGFDDVA